MVKNILVTESLSDSMIKAGAKLIERLDLEKSQVKSAFWFYISDEKIWKLFIASPMVSTEGPRKFYKRIVAANESADKDESIISLNDIGVTNTSNQIVQILNIAIITDDGISGIRFSRNTIHGVFIDDCYIYRSNP